MTNYLCNSNSRFIAKIYFIYIYLLSTIVAKNAITLLESSKNCINLNEYKLKAILINARGQLKTVKLYSV